MLNKITLIGRLTRDPETRTTSTGKSIATFSIAVNKRVKPQDPNERDADFFNIKAWNQTADYVTNYLTKGRMIVVDGRIESRRYTDKNGVDREIWEVTANEVSALDRPRDDAGGGQSGPKAAAAAPAAAAVEEYDPFADE